MVDIGRGENPAGMAECAALPGGVNFATNFVFFRDDGHLATRLTTANYWAGYGARAVRFFHILFGAAGAFWRNGTSRHRRGRRLCRGQPGGPRTLRPGPFTGQLFIHAVGVAGHDVVKYALDTYASDSGVSLSCTHDANAWPSERFAGLPAPARG